MKSTVWILVLLLCSVAAGQAPPAAPPKPAAAKPATATSAPPAAIPQAKPDRESIDDMLSLSLFYWRPDHGKPGFRANKFISDPATEFVNFTTKPNRANGGVFTFPTGGANRLEIGYWQVHDSGDIRVPNRLFLLGAVIPSRERLSTEYKITNLRLSWNYLTFPVPAFNAKLRVKSFWEFQYTQIKPVIGFPDIEDNPSPLTPKYSVRYPGVGLGLEYVPSKHFRLEARGSGMTLPGRSRYVDVEATAVARIKRLELFGGMKGYDFRTSVKSDPYMRGRLWGPMAGVRWVFR
ncbi:MAG: hypothetical protein ABI811_18250 [Acidobacteriota bacterium]